MVSDPAAEETTAEDLDFEVKLSAPVWMMFHNFKKQTHPDKLLDSSGQLATSEERI